MHASVPQFQDCSDGCMQALPCRAMLSGKIIVMPLANSALRHNEFSNCPSCTYMTYQLDSAAVADYLSDNPFFFEEHSELLATVKLTSPVIGRAVSLQERQMEVLRDKIKGLELRLADLMRVAQENDAIMEKFQRWTQTLLLARNDVDLPHVLVDGLKTIFAVPQASLRIWKAAETFSHTWFAAPVSEDVRLFSNGLHTPYCGENKAFEAASWLDETDAIRSIAMVSLRTKPEPGKNADTFGLLVMGSPDPARFNAELATDFLSRIGATASAATACLLA
jgi:uncharacterized protein YigA (DUF484 family)